MRLTIDVNLDLKAYFLFFLLFLFFGIVFQVCIIYFPFIPIFLLFAGLGMIFMHVIGGLFGFYRVYYMVKARKLAARMIKEGKTPSEIIEKLNFEIPIDTSKYEVPDIDNVDDLKTILEKYGAVVDDAKAKGIDLKKIEKDMKKKFKLS